MKASGASGDKSPPETEVMSPEQSSDIILEMSERKETTVKKECKSPEPCDLIE